MWKLIVSIIQIVIGLAAIGAYIVIAVTGETMGKWTVTLILAIAFVVMGIIGVADWAKARSKK